MNPKPVKGTERARLRAKRRAVSDGERNAKDEVRERDPHCRWPHPTRQSRLKCFVSHNEVAHLDGKGMGGNKDGSRNVVENLIVVCGPVHQGPGSIHDGKKRIDPILPELGARGPCVYSEKRGDHWIEIGRDDIDDRW